MAGLWKIMMAKKVLSSDDMVETKLDRVLTTVDLTFLGVGSTLGLGIYILAGQVANQQAGPAVCISFLVAAIASFLAGLCYAEFGSRVPRAGSAYVYSYVSVGQIMAFVIGWNLILEYVIGTASVAKGYSSYFNELIDDAMSDALTKVMPINVTGLNPYPDFFAFGISVTVSGILCIGVSESMTFNTIFTILNLFVVLYVIICGCFKANVKNWQLPGDCVGSGNGIGGFMPYGFSGMMSGAATCFYGFVGFDAVATTGEEAKNPQKSIPLAILFSLTIVFIAYFGISAVLTLMIPYYNLNIEAPIPDAFSKVGWPVAMWVVSIGAMFGLSTSLLGAMFPLPRVIYAMANDGLIFSFMGYVHPRFQTPVYGTIFAGLFAGIMAMFFSLNALVNMMSIGTLMAYSLVAISVLVLRYRQTEEDILDEYGNEGMPLIKVHYSTMDAVMQLVNYKRLSRPNSLTSGITSWTVFIYSIIVVATTLTLINTEQYLADLEAWAIATNAALIVLLIILIVIIGIQPNSIVKPKFMVPLVPFIPCVSVFINIYLMMKLSVDTWYRFAIWMFIGFLIYFLYAVPVFSPKFWRMLKANTEEKDNINNIVHERASIIGFETSFKQVIPDITIHSATPNVSRTTTPVEGKRNYGFDEEEFKKIN